MNAKGLIRFALLAFVVVAVVIMVSRQIKERSDAESSEASVEQPRPSNGVLVYYFHGDVRCPTCRSIEKYAQEAVQSQYPSQLASGELLWQVINYEKPENEHFIKEFELVSPTVVLIRRENGTQKDWRNLARVWELVGDQAAFTGYVQEEVSQMLAATNSVAAHHSN